MPMALVLGPTVKPLFVNHQLSYKLMHLWFEAEVNNDSEYGEDNEEGPSEPAEGWGDLLLEDEDESLTLEMDTDRE